MKEKVSVSSSYLWDFRTCKIWIQMINHNDLNFTGFYPTYFSKILNPCNPSPNQPPRHSWKSLSGQITQCWYLSFIFLVSTQSHFIWLYFCSPNSTASMRFHYISYYSWTTGTREMLRPHWVLLWTGKICFLPFLWNSRNAAEICQMAQNLWWKWSFSLYLDFKY